MRSSAGRRPNDGRHSQFHMHRGLDGSDMPSSSPVGRLSSHLLVADSCMHDRSSESGRPGRDCADPTLRLFVHPGLLPDVGLDGDVLLQRYAQVPDDFRAKVTLFGVQPGLSMLDQRLCLDKLGIWGFGVGVLCRKGSKVLIRLP